jgi:hypothetical protein
MLLKQFLIIPVFTYEPYARLRVYLWLGGQNGPRWGWMWLGGARGARVAKKGPL